MSHRWRKPLKITNTKRCKASAFLQRQFSCAGTRASPQRPRGEPGGRGERALGRTSETPTRPAWDARAAAQTQPRTARPLPERCAVKPRPPGQRLGAGSPSKHRCAHGTSPQRTRPQDRAQQRRRGRKAAGRAAVGLRRRMARPSVGASGNADESGEQTWDSRRGGVAGEGLGGSPAAPSGLCGAGKREGGASTPAAQHGAPWVPGAGGRGPSGSPAQQLPSSLDGLSQSLDFLAFIAPIV